MSRCAASTTPCRSFGVAASAAAREAARARVCAEMTLRGRGEGFLCAGASSLPVGGMPSLCTSCACNAAASDEAPREPADPGRDELTREPAERGRAVVAEDGRAVADDGRPDGAEPGRWPTVARSTCSPSSGCSVGWLRPIRCIQAGVGLLAGAELGRPRPTGALRTGADAGRPGRIGGRLEDTAAIFSDQPLRRKHRSTTKCRRLEWNVTERTATQRTNRNTTAVSIYLSRIACRAIPMPACISSVLQQLACTST